jgi:hypothetical protein
MAADVPDDIFQNVMNEGMESHDILLGETVANIQNVHNVARVTGVRKYNEVDPIESAAVEVVLSKFRA